MDWGVRYPETDSAASAGAGTTSIVNPSSHTRIGHGNRPVLLPRQILRSIGRKIPQRRQNPIRGWDAGINFFRYVRNNPRNRIDPVTALGVGNIPKTYTACLQNGLKRARLGVLTNLFGSGPEYEEVNEVMAKAIDALKERGAVIVRVEDAALDTKTLTANFRLNEPEFKAALNGYLQQQGAHVPVHSLAEIIASGQYHKPTLPNFRSCGCFRVFFAQISIVKPCVFTVAL